MERIKNQCQPLVQNKYKLKLKEPRKQDIDRPTENAGIMVQDAYCRKQHNRQIEKIPSLWEMVQGMWETESLYIPMLQLPQKTKSTGIVSD